MVKKKGIPVLRAAQPEQYIIVSRDETRGPSDCCCYSLHLTIHVIKLTHGRTLDPFRILQSVQSTLISNVSEKIKRTRN